jgi:hypothetical protein
MPEISQQQLVEYRRLKALSADAIVKANKATKKPKGDWLIYRIVRLNAWCNRMLDAHAKYQWDSTYERALKEYNDKHKPGVR